MKRFLKWFLITILCLIVLVVGFFAYINTIFKHETKKYTFKEYTIEKVDSCTSRIGNNWLRKEQPGLFTLYIEGKPFERGLIAGQLTHNLIYKQEKAFVEQLQRIVPSRFYINFLKYVIAIFDLNLYRSIPEERKAEIYGISLSASDTFNSIASNYQRILNYHGAHDLGHMLSNLGMVGCTSFGVWDEKTPDGKLLIGRNFDFYVGDEFAKEKIIAFIRPDSGYFHTFVTWGGMMGAVSGMNEKGLTVTINAANSNVVLAAATPVSLVARQILQYASNIDEAVAVASKFDVFVSELFLIGSAYDNKAIIIEKRPGSQILYETNKSFIISTNHFQSTQNGSSAEARKQKLNTASGYRNNLVMECLNQQKQFTAQDVVKILRDTLGNQGKSIGLGNEKTINQLIGHHSIIFYPEKRMFWVSTSPYQIGGFVCYDLNKMIDEKALVPGTRSVIDSAYIQPDREFLIKSLPRYQHYLNLKKKISAHTIDEKEIEMFVSLNSDYFDAYEQAGDYYVFKNQYSNAMLFYEKSLRCEMPGEKEIDRIRKKYADCQGKTNKNSQ
ncbi:MAG: peptidase C45 [Bacteroidales bacterium]|nr:peptidase C45 [Bacteroidales bacterium]